VDITKKKLPHRKTGEETSTNIQGLMGREGAIHSNRKGGRVLIVALKKRLKGRNVCSNEMRGGTVGASTLGKKRGKNKRGES